VPDVIDPNRPSCWRCPAGVSNTHTPFPPLVPALPPDLCGMYPHTRGCVCTTTPRHRHRAAHHLAPATPAGWGARRTCRGPPVPHLRCRWNQRRSTRSRCLAQVGRSACTPHHILPALLPSPPIFSCPTPPHLTPFPLSDPPKHTRLRTEGNLVDFFTSPQATMMEQPSSLEAHPTYSLAPVPRPFHAGVQASQPGPRPPSAVPDRDLMEVRPAPKARCCKPTRGCCACPAHRTECCFAVFA